MFPLIEQPVSQYIWQTYIWLSWLSHLLTWLFSTSLKKKDYCASQSLSRNGNPLQYSCLENSMDRGAWWATVHGAAESWTWLSTYTQRPLHCMPAPECPSKRLHHRLPCPNLQLFLFQGQWPSHLPQPMSIYSKTQSHIFFHTNWMTDSVPECLAMKRIFASIVFGDHPEWYWSTATIHFQLAPMYQDHPSMKLTRDFPSSVNQSSLALQRSTWSRGNELREGGWCSRDGQPVCVCVCVCDQLEEITDTHQSCPWLILHGAFLSYDELLLGLPDLMFPIALAKPSSCWAVLAAWPLVVPWSGVLSLLGTSSLPGAF